MSFGKEQKGKLSWGGSKGSDMGTQDALEDQPRMGGGRDRSSGLPSRIRAFRGWFPMDDRAFEYLENSLPKVQEIVLRDFAPTWMGESDYYSGLVTAFVRSVKARVGDGVDWEDSSRWGGGGEDSEALLEIDRQLRSGGGSNVNVWLDQSFGNLREILLRHEDKYVTTSVPGGSGNKFTVAFNERKLQPQPRHRSRREAEDNDERSAERWEREGGMLGQGRRKTSAAPRIPPLPQHPQSSQGGGMPGPGRLADLVNKEVVFLRRPDPAAGGAGASPQLGRILRVEGRWVLVEPKSPVPHGPPGEGPVPQLQRKWVNLDDRPPTIRIRIRSCGVLLVRLEGVIPGSEEESEEKGGKRGVTSFESGEALLLKRANNRYRGGRPGGQNKKPSWDFPKGHCLELENRKDPQGIPRMEREEECALRELREETGIPSDKVELMRFPDGRPRAHVHDYDSVYSRWNAPVQKSLVIFLGMVRTGEQVEVRVATHAHSGFEWHRFHFGQPPSTGDWKMDPCLKFLLSPQAWPGPRQSQLTQPQPAAEWERGLEEAAEREAAAALAAGGVRGQRWGPVDFDTGEGKGGRPPGGSGSSGSGGQATVPDTTGPATPAAAAERQELLNQQQLLQRRLRELAEGAGGSWHPRAGVGRSEEYAMLEAEAEQLSQKLQEYAAHRRDVEAGLEEEEWAVSRSRTPRKSRTPLRRRLGEKQRQL
jgi:8-oxo-dGTP pyrophosphatase MutT (NUDIX family)